jgi:hypothetical protein
MNQIFKIRAAGILIMLAMPAVFSLGVMLLWNALFPGILGLPALHYRQTAGLLLLSWILFGGLGGLGGRFFMVRGGHVRDGRLFHHGNPLREKWMSMTDEERKAFIAKQKDFIHFHRSFSRFHKLFGEGAPGNTGNTGNEGKNDA